MADAIRRVSLRRGYDPAELRAGRLRRRRRPARLRRRRPAWACGRWSCRPTRRCSARWAWAGPCVERFVERQVLEPLERRRRRDRRTGSTSWAEQAVDAVVAAGVRARSRSRVRRRILHLRFAGQDAHAWRSSGRRTRRSPRRSSERYVAALRPPPREPRRRAGVDARRGLVAARRASRSRAGAARAAHGRAAGAPARPLRRARGGEVPAFDREALAARRDARRAGAGLRAAQRHRGRAGLARDAWTARRRAGPRAGRGAERRRRVAERPEADPAGAVHATLRHARSRRWASGWSAPRSRPTSRSGSTSPARCSTPTASWWSTRRTSRCTSARWACACAGCAETLPLRARRRRGHQPPGLRRLAPARRHGGHAGLRAERGGRLLGYVASRAHHAEIGGSRPGSMPPDGAHAWSRKASSSRRRYLVERGEPRWDAMRDAARGGPYPTRNVEDNLADLRAAAAANHAGRRGAARARRDPRRGDGAALHGAARAAGREPHPRGAARRSPTAGYEAEERLDDGTPLRVRIDARAATRRGSTSPAAAGVHPGNLNATPAIVRSAVIYVLRLLLDEPLPLNEGLLRAVSIAHPARACSTRPSPTTRRGRPPSSAATSRPASGWWTRCSRRWASPPAARAR